jgi:hypothetical protein
MIDNINRFIEQVLSYHKSYCNKDCFNATDIIDCLLLEIGLFNIIDDKDKVILASKVYDKDKFNHLFTSVHNIFKEYVQV